MSAIYGTNLATDGLEILFDPNNPGSYPGSGDSIFDLSGNSRTGTLYGSPCLLYTSPSPRDTRSSRMPSSA